MDAKVTAEDILTPMPVIVMLLVLLMVTVVIIMKQNVWKEVIYHASSKRLCIA